MGTSYLNESYECRNCSGPIGEQGEVNGWRCGACGATLLIHAEDSNGRGALLERVQPELINKHDLIIPDGSNFDTTYEVLEVSKERGGTYRMALRGFGVRKKINARFTINRLA